MSAKLNVENPYYALLRSHEAAGTDPQTDPCFKTNTQSDDQGISRLQADVGVGDRNLLRAACPQQGIYGFVLTTLFMKFCAELRAQGIVDFSREEDFLNAVTGCRLVFPESKGKKVEKPAKEKKAKSLAEVGSEQ